MKIRNFIHKGLGMLYFEDRAKGVPPDSVAKIRKMLAYLEDIRDPDELRDLPLGKSTRWPATEKASGAWLLLGIGG